jgi:lincosamide nucleotidyltransferase A/C/D/E
LDRCDDRDLLFRSPAGQGLAEIERGMPAVRDTMQANEVVKVLQSLESASVQCWVDGGWGVDALLGRQTRTHSDLDLVIRRECTSAARDTLQQLGYVHDQQATPGWPARLVLRTAAGQQIDLHPVVIDGAGNGWQEIAPGAWGLYTAQGLTGTGMIAGHPVDCLTPELQLQQHLGYAWTIKDRQDMERLAERFGLALPPCTKAGSDVSELTREPRLTLSVAPAEQGDRVLHYLV